MEGTELVRTLVLRRFVFLIKNEKRVWLDGCARIPSGATLAMHEASERNQAVLVAVLSAESKVRIASVSKLREGPICSLLILLFLNKSASTGRVVRMDCSSKRRMVR